MDRFLKSSDEKNNLEYPRGHRVLVVLGKSGIGKTWLLNHMFGERYISLTYDILKSKQSTLDFIDKAKGTATPVILDEYETLSDLVGLRELTGAPTSGMFVIASQVPVEFEFDYFTWMMPQPTIERLIEISNGRATRALAEESNGDIRFLLTNLEFKSDLQDSFQTPRQFIYSLLDKSSTTNPVDFVGDHVHEHGYMWGVVEENYTETKDATLDELADIAESMSRASIVDDRIYEGDWELMPYFTVDACIYPAFKINHRLDEAKLRPGSLWTKFQNTRMRNKKMRALSRRTTHSTLDIDAILVLRDYCVSESPDVATSLLQDYGLESQDLDVINHIALVRKMKTKVLGTLKKNLA